MHRYTRGNWVNDVNKSLCSVLWAATETGAWHVGHALCISSWLVHLVISRCNT